jgi:hypothetical protein
MYSKPEVSRYTGLELLDLMGPVETAYCDLSGVQEDCALIFELETPNGLTLEDLDSFEKDKWRIHYVLTGPETGDTCSPVSGECEGPDCIFDLDGGPPSDTHLDLRVNMCDEFDGCNPWGEWKLEAWWEIGDKELLPACTEKVDLLG